MTKKSKLPPALHMVIVYAVEFNASALEPASLRGKGWADGPFPAKVRRERGNTAMTDATAEWRQIDGVLPRVGQVLYEDARRFHVDLLEEVAECWDLTLTGLEILDLHEPSWPGLAMLVIHCQRTLTDCSVEIMNECLSKGKGAFKSGIHPKSPVFSAKDSSLAAQVRQYLAGARHDRYVWLPFTGTFVQGATQDLDHRAWSRFADLSLAGLKGPSEKEPSSPPTIANWRVSAKASGIFAEHMSQTDASGNFHSVWTDGFLLHWAEVAILERIAAKTASLGDPADSASEFRELNRALRVFRNRWWWREFAIWDAANSSFRAVQEKARSLERFEALQDDHNLFISAIQAEEARRFNRLAVFLSVVSGVGASASILALFSDQLPSGTTFTWLVLLSLAVTVTALIFYASKGDRHG